MSLGERGPAEPGGGRTTTPGLQIAPGGLVLVPLDGPALVCADGVCTVPDDEAAAEGLGAAQD